MDSLTQYLLGDVGVKVAAAPLAPVMPAVPGIPTKPMQKFDKKGRALQELSMWQTWKKSGHKEEHLAPLMTSLEPAIKYHVNKWKAANVPENLLKIRARQIAVDSLKRYKPTQGHGGRVASPGSWVQKNMGQLQRFVVANQNAGRIQESRAGKNKRAFDDSYQYLRETLGRDPIVKELTEAMTTKLGKPVTQKQVRMYIREQRRDNTVSDENFTYTPTDTRILIKLLPEELTPIENQVLERMFGLNGCRKMKPGEIARDLRIDNSRVSRIKNKINKKAQEYI